ncbi:trehalose-phosphatase [Rhizobium sp. CFBP 8762]|uniref:trehalose-phosphatase n=1 Tax=Rhizobium sp. CFBP 8762 TaxID=2775279 RepID=UPI00177E6623|nr:trehalose-phosphatase [Rhizobium sp. CFBP 8762]MBD8555921.1 trehalose-phosphatase [Rhizobium sp. CFBP 8762]
MQDEETIQSILRVLRGEPDRWALFLDIDGTLLDLALTPEGIFVPPDLPPALNAVSQKLGGALALVTGRALPFADSLFAPFRFPVAGLHGAEMRLANGLALLAQAPPAFEALKQALTEEASQWPGVLIEDKGAAVAAHYRLAPEFEHILSTRMQVYAERAGPDWTLQLGKMVYEIRPSKASKGEAIQRFMLEPPFEGRLPMTLGDDLTDESMFLAANTNGGYSVRVGTQSPETHAVGRLTGPQDVRRIIERLASNA